MAAKLDKTHDDIYADVRAFLINLFPLPDEKVIRGYSNNVPFPQAPFICINIITESALATNVNEYAEESGRVMQTQEVQMQVDFYGQQSGEMSRTFANLWRDFYACDRLSVCQPLYTNDPQYLPFTNESSDFEERWMVSAYLNYNPVVTHEQSRVSAIDISINNL